MNKTRLNLAMAMILPACVSVGCSSQETRTAVDDVTVPEQQLIEEVEHKEVGEPVTEPVLAEQIEHEFETIVEIKAAVEEVKEAQPEHRIFYFDSNSSDIRQDDFERLIAHAEYLIKHPQIKLKISGHADISGDSHYNQQLAQQRAESTARILMDYGVLAAQIDMQSLGEDSPVAGFEHAIEDRRVELEYVIDTQLSEVNNF